MPQQIDPAYAAYLQQQQAAAAQAELEAFEEFADEDPVGAMNYLAEGYAAEVRAQMQAEIDQRLAPVLREHATATASGTIGQLCSEFGDDLVELHAPTLAASLEGNEAAFAGPDGRPDMEKVLAHARTVIQAAEYQRGLDYASGGAQEASLKSAIRGASPIRSEQRPGPEVGGTPTGVNPPRPASSNVDPAIAAIRNIEAPGNDMFGRRWK
jgi:hypothetical protein